MIQIYGVLIIFLVFNIKLLPKDYPFAGQTVVNCNHLSCDRGMLWHTVACAGYHFFRKLCSGDCLYTAFYWLEITYNLPNIFLFYLSPFQ